VRDLARPADDVFLGVAVEIAFVKRKGIERVEQLRYLVDPNLDRLRLPALRHDIPLQLSPIA
jgi:hypothetical protein